MRITARQLRQIIREELTRGPLREADTPMPTSIGSQVMAAAAALKAAMDEGTFNARLKNDPAALRALSYSFAVYPGMLAGQTHIFVTSLLGAGVFSGDGPFPDMNPVYPRNVYTDAECGAMLAEAVSSLGFNMLNPQPAVKVDRMDPTNNLQVLTMSPTGELIAQNVPPRGDEKFPYREFWAVPV